MSIAIYTAHDNNNIISQYVHILDKIKKQYCQQYNYKYYLANNVENNGFIRIYLGLQLLLENPTIDWLCWMDHDVLIMNHTIPLTNFIDDNYEFIIGEDWNGINSGVFFLKNTPAIHAFLSNILNYKPTFDQCIQLPKWWVESEQCPMSTLLSSIKYKLVHHSLFNGYVIGPRPDNDWRCFNLGPKDKHWIEKRFEIGDFAIHFAGCTINDRIKYISEYESRIIYG